MKKLCNIFCVLLLTVSGLCANGGGSIHDQISRTATGKIYFFERYNESNLNIQVIDEFVNQWIEHELNAMDIISHEMFQDSKTGIIRLHLEHEIDNTELLQKNGAISDSIISTAHYTLKFLIHNHKLKVVMDNMYTSHVGVTHHGVAFQQTESIEDTYGDLRKFELQIYEKAEELQLDRCTQLKKDIARMQNQIKKIKPKDKNIPRNVKLIRRYNEKNKTFQRLNNPETLKQEIDNDLKEKIDYTTIYQFQKWNDINTSIKNSLLDWTIAEASN